MIMNMLSWGGPWMIMDHYLMVKDWVPNFDPATDETKKLIVWVRFPDLPVEYYDYDFLMKLGEKIGEPKNIDDATSLVSRGKFARMCVEVDLAKPLIAKFKLRKKVRRIEYEGLHLVCFNCGVYGHMADSCKKGNDETEAEGEGHVTRTEESERPKGNEGKKLEIRPEVAENFGPWMLASKPAWKNFRTNGKKEQQTIAGSRYALLEEKGEDLNKSETSEYGMKDEHVVGEQGVLITDEQGDTSQGNKRGDKNKGKRPAVVVNEKQIEGENAVEKKSNSESTSRGPQSIGGVKEVGPKRSNRSAEMSEHILVRGERNGTDSTRQIIVTDGEIEEINDLSIFMDQEHHGDPPSTTNDGEDIHSDDALETNSGGHQGYGS